MERKFVERIVSDVCAYFGDKVECEIRKVEKVNKTSDAIFVTSGGGIGVCLYPDNYPWDNYESQIKFFIKDIENEIGKMPSINTSINKVELRNYDKMKKKLVVELISKSGNEQLLKKVPYKDFEDMALIYRLDLSETQEGATILLTNQLLNSYGVSKENLEKDAYLYSSANRPLEIKSMREMLIPYYGEEAMKNAGPEMDLMYIVSNPQKIMGASVITYPEFYEKMKDRLGTDSFYILPSSIHECICVPFIEEFADRNDELLELVKHVNATEVYPLDKLTDSVYFCDHGDIRKIC